MSRRPTKPRPVPDRTRLAELLRRLVLNQTALTRALKNPLADDVPRRPSERNAASERLRAFWLEQRGLLGSP